MSQGLFSSFVPLGLFYLPVNWLSGVTCLLLIPMNFWLMNNQYLTFFKGFLNAVTLEMNSIYGKLASPGSSFMGVSLFVYLILNNYLGLLPYVFTSSSHLTFTLSLALPLWVGHMIYGLYKSFDSMLAHFVPLSTPFALIPLMVLIELVSSLIRPLTLSVRLAANMVAGHLLMTLISQDLSNLGVLIFFPCFFGLVLLLVLESAVSIIQSYVFSLLMTLYLQEVMSVKTMLV